VSSTTPRFCILTERQVGIGSAAAALEPHLRARPDVVWADITYVQPGGWVERLDRWQRGGPLRGFLQTGAALRQGPFDALFFLTHNPAVFRQHEVGRTPTLLWTDVTPKLLDAQADQYAHQLDRSGAVRMLKHGLVRRTFQRAALCVGWSAWAQRSFIADYGIPEAKTRVVPPGIELARWQLPAARPNNALPRVLFVGGHFMRKGGDLLLDVFRSQLRGRCELDLVTRDPIPEEPGVRVHRGMQPGSPELLALYAGSDLFALPTRGDCFSIASIEAMAMGLPVVVTAVGGIPEIVEEGRSGHLIAPGDPRGLLAALEPLLADGERRSAFGRRGRALVEERFDSRRTSERMLQLLREISGTRSGTGTGNGRPAAHPKA
jgi:glycosyltransferase involved in cell wall biosynthesis